MELSTNLFFFTLPLVEFFMNLSQSVYLKHFFCFLWELELVGSAISFAILLIWKIM